MTPERLVRTLVARLTRGIPLTDTRTLLRATREVAIRSTIVCGLVVSGLLAGAALAADQRPVEPGGKIGAMTVVRGDTYDADVVMVEVCPTIITKPGKYHRSCSVPKVPRLHIGESHFARTQKELDISWKTRALESLG
jgi:hypothetical protein